MSETSPDAHWAQESRAADVAAQRLLRRVLRQWWLIALCAVVAAVAAFIASSARTKQYEAESRLQVGNNDLIAIFLSDSVRVDDTDPDRQLANAQETFNLPNVRDRAVALMAKPGNGSTPTDADTIKNAITVTTVPNSSVLKITARTTNPQLSRNMANAMVAAFLEQRKAVARDKIVSAKASITQQYNNLTQAEKNSVTGQALQQRLRQVGALGALSDGNGTVLEGARRPTDPVAPSPKRDAVLGFIAGLLLGLGIAVLRARLDDRIRDADELSELWDLPVVGIVPQTGALKESGAIVPEPAALEALSLARTNLRYLRVGGDVKTVALTSAIESEGKSTLAWNLAIASALAGTKVIVVEADLRRPRISARLGLSGAGLSEVLAGIATVGDAITAIEVKDSSGSVAAEVDVLPAGLVPPSPVALLEGPELAPTLAALREQYDVVLIDTPPATVVADAVALVDDLDGIVIVSRLGTVRRGAYKRLREILTGVDAPVIGQIVNGQQGARSYGYYTSYTAAPAKTKVSA